MGEFDSPQPRAYMGAGSLLHSQLWPATGLAGHSTVPFVLPHKDGPSSRADMVHEHLFAALLHHTSARCLLVAPLGT
jgi:hypothetical protein